MTTKGPFQLFIPHFWLHLQARYDFVTRATQSLCAAVPKSCSFNFGASPRFGKLVVVHLQHSSKAYDVGEFRLNVHISQKLEPAKPWLGNANSFAAFGDGYYRLSVCVEAKDLWWCIAPKGELYAPRKESRLAGYWEPSSYAVQSQIFDEASAAVCSYLDSHLFPLAGFTSKP